MAGKRFEGNRSSFLMINLAAAFAVLLLLMHASTMIDDDGAGEEEMSNAAQSQKERLFSKAVKGVKSTGSSSSSSTTKGESKKSDSSSSSSSTQLDPKKWLYPTPTDQEFDDAFKVYQDMCDTKEAWDQELWFGNHNMSVERQLLVREKLNLMGQHRVSRLAAKTKDELKPCKRTVVSVSTLPKRFERLGGLIRSLKWQTYPPDAIIIGVPPFAPRVRQQYVVPDYIKNDPAITIVDLPIDYGPVSKVAAAILHEKDPDTCIITVDDDNQPREYFFKKLVTWASLFPTSVIGESGWNVSCITGRVPYICGGGYDTYLFVRQDFDFMCHPTSLPIYNIHQCVSPIDLKTVRATDVIMGVSNPLYRRSMFDDDFLDIASIVARRKVEAMLKEDEAARVAEADRKKREKETGVKETPAKKEGDENNEDAHKHGPESKKAPDLVVEMAHAALAHPALQPNEAQKVLERLPPPSPIFMVDDVYISAYLSMKGVPRLVVPGTEDSKIPIKEYSKPKKDWPAAPAPPDLPNGPGIENIDALHSESMFNEANYAATRYFHHIGYWGGEKKEIAELANAAENGDKFNEWSTIPRNDRALFICPADSYQP